MSENQNRGARDFSQYDTMETEELEELLRFDTDAPEGAEPDVELMLYVLGVLDKRGRIKEVTGDRAQEAYESFKRDYFPEDVHIEEEPKVVECRPLRWVRRLTTAAAAVLVFVMLGTVTASAFGFNFWRAVAVWAQETFHFQIGEEVRVDDPNPDIDLPYESLEDAIYTLEMATGIVPTWIPEGYVLTDITIDETPMQKVYVGYYEFEEMYFEIVIQSYLNTMPEQVEKSEDYAETYPVSDVVYYLFSDKDTMQVAWTNDSYECYISGNVTANDLKMMVDSIKKG